MGSMEDRWRRRQTEAQPAPPPPAAYQVDNGQFTEEQRAEAYRVESMQQMQRQTKAIESIRGYVAIWFWLTIVGAVIIAIATSSASQF